MMSAGPAALCNLCGKSAPSRCSACGMVSYCCREHQKLDWKEHRLACKEFQAMRSQGQVWEADVKQDEYSGTFRWSQKRDFLQLPAYSSPPCLEYGWQEYLQTRFDDSSDDKVVLDVALLDGLSFPMSFLFALRRLLESQPETKDSLYTGARKLAIIAIGCAERAEEHILHHTNYWDEISNLMPSFQLQLWLVGPEMSTAAHLRSRELCSRMAATCYRGTLSGFLAEKHVTYEKMIVIGYNTGMASGDAHLKRSWRADVELLLQQRLLTIFTCANDHTDLKCESELLAGLHAQYVLTPTKNLFAAVTTLHPPGQQATGWYSANAFIYAVQGKVHDKHATLSVGRGNPPDPAVLGDACASQPSMVHTAGSSQDPDQPATSPSLGATVELEQKPRDTEGKQKPGLTNTQPHTAAGRKSPDATSLESEAQIEVVSCSFDDLYLPD